MNFIAPLTEDEKRRRDRGNVADGEYIGFDLAFLDSAPRAFLTDAASPPKSIDEALQAEIAQAAKNNGQKPSEWLAGQSAAQIEKLIAGVATRFVQSAGAAGVAKVFNMDAAVGLVVDRERADHEQRFAFLGDAAPRFDRERAMFLARSRMVVGSDAAVRDAASAARYDYTPSRPAKTGPTAAVTALDGRAVRDAARLAQYG